MFKKIFFALIIVVIGYLILVFQAPNVASKIEGLFGLDINSSILKWKKQVDTISTTVPSKDEVIKAYNDIYSGAVDLKETATEKTNEVKAKVDEVRNTLSGAQNTVEDTIKTIDETKKNIEKLQKIGSDITNIISSGSTLKK